MPRSKKPLQDSLNKENNQMDFRDSPSQLSVPTIPALKGLSIQNRAELMEFIQQQVAQNLEENAALLREKDILLYLNNAIAFVRNKEELQHKLNNTLKEIFGSNGMMVFLFDLKHSSNNQIMLQFDLGKKSIDNSFVVTEPEILLAPDSIITSVINNREPLVWTITELMKLNNRPNFITQFRENQIKKIAGLQLSEHLGLKGVLFLFADNPEAFGQGDLKILKGMADPVSLALLRVLEHEEVMQKDKQDTFLLELTKKLLEISSIAQLDDLLQSEFSKIDFLPQTSISLLSFEDKGLTFSSIKKLSDITLRQDFPGCINEIMDEQDAFSNILKELKESQVLLLSDLLKAAPNSSYLNKRLASGLNMMIVAPLNHRSGFTGAILLLSKKEENLQRWLNLLDAVASLLAPIIHNFKNYEMVKNQLNEVKLYQDKLEVENLYLQEEIQTTHNYNEIVGTSRKMKEVYNLVSQVAGADSSVLILGETGTGKELIARAIHNASLRKNHVMVKVNCAALPPSLIESELFGHEKGSFTDAMERRIGKFELANNSTIFLDEIGELPLVLQAKLLRVLQEKEIERVGGKVTIKTDVRVIAATNKDLLKELQSGNFRSDLYFRLNVFPISLPPLRERKEDIPLLANYFAEKHTKKIITKNTRFTSKAMKQLIAYNWPGNVRELEHLVERSVLMARGNIINQVYLPGVEGDGNDQLLRNTDVKTIDEIERAHILAVLKMVNGKVSGVGGAAEILKIPATTLSSKILRLKIKKGIS